MHATTDCEADILAVEKRDLIDLAAPFWAGEAEVVQRYFAGPRSDEADLYWLRAQAFKETRHLRALPPEMQEQYWTSGTIPDHPEGPEETGKLAEEMKHFELIAALIQSLSGRRAVLEDLPLLEEERKLQELRAPYRAGTEFERTLVDFTEGGGGSMYEMLTRVEGGEFERRIAAAFRVILADEVIHGPGQIHELARLSRDEATWQRAGEMVVAIGKQRLRMRNEMFSFPLDERRIAEIEAGAIEPWPSPVEIE